MSDSILNNMEAFTIKQVYKFSSKDGERPLISTGHEHYAISQGRILDMAGNNTYGQLGNGTQRNSKVPVPISLPSKIIGIACGQCFTVVITKEGKTYSWGHHTMAISPTYCGSINSSVKKGTKDNLIPLLVEKIKSRRAIKVAASTWNYIVLFDDGSVFIKVSECREGFMFSLDHKIIDVAINDRAYLVTENGSLFEICIVSSELRCRDVETLNIEDITTTRQIKLPEKAVKISASTAFRGTFLTILLESGKVYTHYVSDVWTTDDGMEHPNVKVGWIGKDRPSGSFLEKRDPPKLVDLGEPISIISSNYDTAMALSKDGKLYIWNPKDAGKIAISPLLDIPTGCRIKNMSAGYNFTILLLDNGGVYYWGNEKFPMLKI